MNNQHHTHRATVAMQEDTARKLQELARRSGGSPSDVIHTAVERMWVQEVEDQLPALPAVQTQEVDGRLPARVEVWTLRAESEALYAVVLVGDSPFVATGPIRPDELPELTDPAAGVVVFGGWSSALAEQLAVKREQYARWSGG